MRSTVGGFLRASYGDVSTDSDGDFVVRRDGVVTWVRLLPGPEGMEATVVLVWSIPNAGVRVDAELTRYLATEAANLSFGQFELDEREIPTVHISHALLGEFLSREELEVAVTAVTSAASHYGPLIKERFGGQLTSEAGGVFSEALSAVLGGERSQGSNRGGGTSRGGGIINTLFTGPSPGGIGRRRSGERTRKVQAVFGVLAFVIGLGAAAYSYDASSSWALPVFVFFMTAYFIGRGVADVVTDSEKIKRALYFATMPAVATGVLYLSYRWWDRWWLAVLLGFVVGVPLGVVVGAALFRRIAQEELEDDQQRARQRRVGV